VLAMVTNFDAISTSLALKIINSNKNLAIMLDYGDGHHMLKKFVVGNHLNTISQATKRSPDNNHIPKIKCRFQLIYIGPTPKLFI
jgi:hypothetical protein